MLLLDIALPRVVYGLAANQGFYLYILLAYLRLPVHLYDITISRSGGVLAPRFHQLTAALQ